MIKPLKPGTACLFAAALVALLMWGCARVPGPTVSPRVGDGGKLGSCADLFAALDRRTSADGVVDAGAFGVARHPYLRVDRFLASFRPEVKNDEAFGTWVDWMQALDLEGRRYEIANLQDPDVVAVSGDPDRRRLLDRITACGDRMKLADLKNSRQREKLRASVAAPADYIPLRRVLGLYPLTRMFVLQGVARWHEQARRTFSVDPPDGTGYIRYAPEDSAVPTTTRRMIAAASVDALGIPRYTPAERDALFRAHAPVWQVKTNGTYDRPGTPIRASDGSSGVDTATPVVYTRMSFARFGERVLTQLNYVIWFSARPKDHVLDLFGGVLDGVNLRITLDGDGEPLLLETIHNCGCYYKAFPTDRLKVRQAIAYPEPPLILRAPRFRFPDDRATVTLDSRTHYVTHMYTTDSPVVIAGVTYTLSAYDSLRSLSRSTGGRRSLFHSNGTVPSSRRLERFVLWPTGVLSPGAMRQWGRHAVAFVGERHFDDPHAIENMFDRTAQQVDPAIHLSRQSDTLKQAATPDPAADGTLNKMTRNDQP